GPYGTQPGTRRARTGPLRAGGTRPPPLGTSSVARGGATGSPGLLSGNAVQVPLDVPLNVCGNTVDVVALLNPAFGNGCGNGAPAPDAPDAAPAPPRTSAPRTPPPRTAAARTAEDGRG
ncbi:Small secreted domain, partial [Streptomyces sp. SolWspMP-sol7th]|uniref:chaplin n=1 Tax=Streptomyces sp. SolWspMP-sol7th TaxID=1839776 RepID=UPI00081DE782